MEGQVYGDFKYIKNLGKINPNRKSNYHLLKCIVCGKERRVISKNGGFDHVYHNKKVCVEYFRNLEIGKCYGDFRVLEYSKNINNKNYYKVKCNVCNRVKEVDINHLQNNKGVTHASCVSSITNHYSKRFHRIWGDMRKRTTNPKSEHYHNYGGRGISSDVYMNFIDFYDDLHEDYLEHLKLHGERDTTLDRIDVNGDYEKDNLRWATRIEQGNNKRNTRKVKCVFPNGEIKTYNNVRELADENGFVQNSIYNVLNGHTPLYRGCKIEYIN